MLKGAYEVKQQSDYRFVLAEVYTSLSSIILRKAQAQVNGESYGTLPTSEECDLLKKRAMISPKHAAEVLAVLKDVMKENKINC
jgi:hypothetical protein